MPKAVPKIKIQRLLGRNLKKIYEWFPRMDVKCLLRVEGKCGLPSSIPNSVRKVLKRERPFITFFSEISGLKK
jgi:hypothetical protein